MSYGLFKNLLFQLSPENAHNIIKSLDHFIPLKSLHALTKIKSPVLESKIGKTKIKNPIGLAAGFDKNGEMLNLMQGLGFGYIELGSITAFPCQGNPKPRVIRLIKDQSIINRMGLPNEGAEAFAKSIRSQHFITPIGINISKTPDFVFESLENQKKTNGIDDYLFTLKTLKHIGSYFVLNLSCPNTNDKKTFEDPELFSKLASEVEKARKNLRITKPILIKLSPDISKITLTKIIEIACKHNLDGFIVSNTTKARPHLKSKIKTYKSQVEKGGLSGKALLELANKQLAITSEIAPKDKIIIGVGGIMGFEDLLTKLYHGASLFQIYTGLIYKGPFFVKELNKNLMRLCQKLGVSNYQELIGSQELKKFIDMKK